MSKATLPVLPGLEGGWVRYEVDCQHATTTIDVYQPTNGAVVSDATVKALVVARHWAEEHCRCTRKLRLPYLTRRIA